MGISIILPVRNEEKRIEKGTKELLSYCNEKEWDFELIFVEDGSTDRTCAIIDKIILTDRRVKMLSIPHRLGKGGAIISAALNFPLKEYVAYMDVDLSAGPAELEKLLEHINNYDLVIGSRTLRGDLTSTKRPFHRLILSHMYSRLFRTLFRISIFDPQCGLKLLRRDITKKLFESLCIPDFAFDTDLIITASSQDLRIKEVPVNWSHGSSSKVRIFREIRTMGIDILSIWYNYHLLWRQHKATYPQKKGSIYGRLLFVLLSHISEIKRRELEHVKTMSLVANLNQNNFAY